MRSAVLQSPSTPVVHAVHSLGSFWGAGVSLPESLSTLTALSFLLLKFDNTGATTAMHPLQLAASGLRSLSLLESSGNLNRQPRTHCLGNLTGAQHHHVTHRSQRWLTDDRIALSALALLLARSELLAKQAGVVMSVSQTIPLC